jgi:hydroxypyruvate reductase
MNKADPRAVLRALFDAAVASADPGPAVARHLPEKPRGRCIVIGAGKASAAMAAGLDAALAERWPDVSVSGVVVTRYGYGAAAGRIEIIEAAHPVPDEASLAASDRLLAAVRGLDADDLVIALMSGGGSALLCAPAQGMSLADKRAVNQALLASGASINDMNVVRRHLSRIKGGRLALAAAPARVVTLLISDVPGDDPAAIASGPTLPDPSSLADARAIVARYRMVLPPAALEALALGPESPKPGAFATDIRMIASPALALKAAAAKARALGVTPLILGDSIEGEAREAAIVFAGIARSAAAFGLPAQRPCVLLSGGECTVTIGPEGAKRGGRNTEFLLSLALALKGEPDIHALACDSDGIDGTEDAAGALVTPDTLARAKQAGLEARAFLAAHDSYSFFEALGDLVKTGPTRTNVNDIRAILIA